MPQVQLNTITVDGVNLFYRSAGLPTAPVLLLLHGFPASSFQYRELIPLLAPKFRLLAPDLPGFGFTEVPAERKYQYTFDSLSVTIEAFLDALGVDKFAVYIFDYGVRLFHFLCCSTHLFLHPLYPCAIALVARSHAKLLTPTILNTCRPRRHSASPCESQIA
jgi:pimeloyl-ACP methyl ester carboxylesterase